MRNAFAVTLIAVGGLVVAFLVWVAATSKSFLARSVSWLVVAEVAMVLAVTVLAVVDVLAWWAAVPIAVVGSRMVFLALRRALPVSLSRFKAQLKEDAPAHWRAGEIEGRLAAESLSAVPTSRNEAIQMRDELIVLAERAHLEQEHTDGTDGCLTFHVAFGEGYWSALWSKGHDLKLDLTPWRKQLVIVRWALLASVVVRLIGGIIILGIALSPRDYVPIRILEVVVGLGFLGWGTSGFRLWRHPDWREVT
jgi:hypothetical protein